MSTFWTMARSLMEEKGLKQVDLVRGVGCSKGTVHAWIKRDTLPPADRAVKIADYLGVTVRYLVTGERSEDELSPLEQRLLVLCQGLSDQRMDVVISVVKDMKAGWMRE